MMCYIYTQYNSFNLYKKNYYCRYYYYYSFLFNWPIFASRRHQINIKMIKTIKMRITMIMIKTTTIIDTLG